MMTTQQHPDPAAIRDAMILIQHAAFWQGRIDIDMAEGKVIKHPCGTVCCHGGLYRLAKKEQAGLRWKEDWKDFPLCGQFENASFLTAPNDSISYQDGAEMLAQDIGMHNQESLCTWAGDNPGLWGNDSGSVMFASALAFDCFQGNISVAHIVAHWLAVADRIEELNKPAVEPAAEKFIRLLEQDSEVLATPQTEKQS